MQAKIKHQFEEVLSRKPKETWASAMSWEDATGVAPGNHLPGGVRAMEKVAPPRPGRAQVCVLSGHFLQAVAWTKEHLRRQFYSRACNVLCSASVIAGTHLS